MVRRLICLAMLVAMMSGIAYPALAGTHDHADVVVQIIDHSNVIASNDGNQGKGQDSGVPDQIVTHHHCVTDIVPFGPSLTQSLACGSAKTLPTAAAPMLSRSLAPLTQPPSA